MQTVDRCSCFGTTYTKIGTIQRRLAWPLRKDDTQIREAFHIFSETRNMLLSLTTKSEKRVKERHFQDACVSCRAVPSKIRAEKSPRQAFLKFDLKSDLAKWRFRGSGEGEAEGNVESLAPTSANRVDFRIFKSVRERGQVERCWWWRWNERHSTHR